ncbi:PHB depolymerase family esterase [Plantactinospora siamensis]|uniref:PHB depolymerase family esterase n=1 Tax=Plantactinospora siamensis TaxID=555372 RepID=A0ABV6P6I1_9ACTN
MTRIRRALAGLSVALAVGGLSVLVPALTGPAAAASLVQVTNFGNNPGGMEMHIYVPDNHPANPAIVVAMHGCGGSGPGFYSGSEFASLADRYGYIVIYPSAEQQAGFGKCFDTWSDAAKRRGGGSDPVSIVSMVTYAEQHYGGDPNRVYATGSSSGGMMTDEMLALYPDVFKAGAAFMGVPFNCFANAADYPPGSSKCTGGSMDRTPQQWGDAVRAAYPGYTGPRPRIQLWHGTADTLVPYSLLQEDIEQWTNVFGLSQTPTRSDTPQSGWNRRQYADSSGTVQVEAYSIQGAGHQLPMSGMAAVAIAFFGLNGANPTTPPPTTAPPTTAPPTTAPPTTAPPTSNPPTGNPPSGACSATYRTINSWSGGFQGEVTVTAGGAAVNGWTVRWTLAGGQTVTQVWNGTLSASGTSVSVRNASYNGSIPPSGSTTFGFLANGSPSNPTLSCTSP